MHAQIRATSSTVNTIEAAGSQADLFVLKAISRTAERHSCRIGHACADQALQRERGRGTDHAENWRACRAMPCGDVARAARLFRSDGQPGGACRVWPRRTRFI